MLEELLAQMNVTNQRLEDSSVAVQGILAGAQQQQEEAISQQKIANEDSLVVLKSKQMAELSAQRQGLKAATDLGTNPDDSAQIMTKLSEEWKASALDNIDKNKQLKSDLDVKFMDDPVGYIKAQLNMKDHIEQADLAIRRQNSVQNSLMFAQSQTQSAVQTATALAATRSDITVQATLEGTAATMNSALAKERVNNAGIQMQGIQQLAGMSVSEINVLSTGVSAVNQAQQLEISKANLANSTKALGLQMQEKLERIANKQADRAELEGLADIVRKGGAALGFDNVSAFPTAKIVQLLNLKDSHMQDFLKAGMQTEAAGTPVVSLNAGETARVVSQTSAPLRKEQSALKSFFSEVWTKAASPEAGLAGKYDNTDVLQVTRASNGLAIQSANEQQTNIKKGDTTNIYAAPPLDTVFAVPAIQNSELYKRVFAEQMVASGLKEFDPQQLVSLTTEAIKRQKISYNDAAVGLQAVFGTAKEINNRTKNYAGFGLPKQMGFRTQVPSGLGILRTYDLSTSQDINNILNSKLNIFSQSAAPVLDSRPFIFN